MSNAGLSLVAQWNSRALEAIRKGDPLPTVVTRGLHMAHAAMYDAWAAYDSEAAAAYSSFTAEGTADDVEVAVSIAAHAVLTEVFAEQRYIFEGFLRELGLQQADGPAVQVGLQAARAVLEARADDGANAQNDYGDLSGYRPADKGLDARQSGQSDPAHRSWKAPRWTGLTERTTS